MKTKIMLLCALIISLFITCVGCSSGGKQVPEDTIRRELGIIADKAQKITYEHNFNNDTKIDTVKVVVTYDNEYCISKGTCFFEYQYFKSDGIWDLLSDGYWEWDEHIKDFSTKQSVISKVANYDGYTPSGNEPEYYFYLDIKPGSVDTENNTLYGDYYVEFCRYNQSKGYFEQEYSYSSNGYECVSANIFPGGAVYLKLEDPSSDQSARLWLNPEDYIDVNLFV